MRVVSEQSEEEIRRRKTREALAPRLRVLAANMLRVVRGAGKPLELLRQMEACSAAIRDYAEAHGCLPSVQLFNQMLDCESTWREYRPWIEEDRKKFEAEWAASGETDRKDAIRKIRNASLQATASMLLDQSTQLSVAENDMCAGVDMFEKARSAIIRRYKNVTVDEALEIVRELKGPSKGRKAKAASRKRTRAPSGGNIDK